tara:strand:- start:88 stop:291 length:204 start_codon:yes stop_codon:yes gene_type:complete
MITLGITSAALLLFFLCLGSQNLSKRHRVNLIINETVELPNGFLIGFSFIIGLLSGSLSSALTIEND